MNEAKPNLLYTLRRLIFQSRFCAAWPYRRRHYSQMRQRHSPPGFAFSTRVRHRFATGVRLPSAAVLSLSVTVKAHPKYEFLCRGTRRPTYSMECFRFDAYVINSYIERTSQITHLQRSFVDVPRCLSIILLSDVGLKFATAGARCRRSFKTCRRSAKLRKSRGRGQKQLGRSSRLGRRIPSTNTETKKLTNLTNLKKLKCT